MPAATKVADVVHKTVATGLIVMTLAGLADVTRGFGILVQRNIERRTGGSSAAAPPTATEDKPPAEQH